MDSVEFELSSWDGSVLVRYFSRISECFDVKIECENAVPRPSRDQPSPMCDELGPVEVGVEGGRTRLKLTANSEHSLLQAKAFIEGVTQASQTEPYERHLTLSPDQFEALVGIHHGVQQETQTIFLFKHETYTVSILGQPAAVKMAQSLATQRILGCDTAEASQGVPQMMPCVVTPSHGAQSHQKLSPTRQRKSRLRRAGPGLKVNMGCWVTGGHGRNAEGEEIEGDEEDAGRMHALSLSPGAESAPDSCYDSDGSRSGSRRSSCTRSDSDLHTDVSRTVSDTLAAELLADVDPVTTKETTSENQLLPPTLPASKNASRKLSVDNGSSNETLVKQETQEFTISGVEAEGMLGTDAAAQVTAGLLAMGLDAGIDSHTAGTLEETSEAEREEQEQEEDEQKVLYGIRLGYSQELTQRVLDKLGPAAGKDDLLQELIRHTEVEKDEEEDEEEEDKPVVCAWVRPSPAVSFSVGEDEDVVDGRTQQPQPSRAVGDLQAAGGKDLTNLRCIIIDGSNIAMSHGNKQVFSCRGIRLAVDYFRERGHTKVTVFVPSWRKEASRQDTQIVDQEILYELEKEGTLVFTPSRWVSGKRIVCYDDLYIIKLAAEDDGVVVSNDNYRDLINKSPEYKKVIEERLLMYSFVNDRFMPPDDPLGRHGPSLDNFLSKQPVVADPLPPSCPYGKKCTYGNKCKYYHPERGTTPRKSVVEVLQEKERVERAKVRSITQSRETSPGDIGSRGKSPTPSGPAKKTLTKTQSLVPVPKPGPAKKTLTRTRSLVPGAMGGASTYSSAAVPPDFLPLKVKAEKQHVHTLTDDVAPGCRVTVTTATPTDTTATTAASELSRKEYDARLSKYRREVEVAESGQQAKHELLSRKSSATNSGPSLESLQLPGSWSSGGASRVPDPLNQLRPRQATHPDPKSDAFMTVGGGHLALAKKLSDEGKADEKRRNPQLGTTSAIDMGAHSSPPRQHQEEKTKKNGHRQLQRQLSLQGSEDPRLLPKGSSRGGSNTAQGGQKPKKDKGPDVIFHGGSGPVHKGPYPHREQETMVHFGQPGSGVTCTFIGDRSEQQHQHHRPHLQHQQQQQQQQQQQHRPLVAMGRRHEIASHSQLQRHSSDGENLRTDRRYMLQQQQQGMRAPPERKQACRMASAPGTYPYLVAGSSGQGPQRRSSVVMPTIHRQNSTSDPQLHILQDNNSSQGNVLDNIVLGMYNPQTVHPGFGGYSGAPESVNNNMMWAQPRSFDVPAGGGGMKNTALFDGHLNLPGPTMDERMPRGGSFDGNLPNHPSTSTSFDNTVHPSASYEDITTNMKYGGLDGNMSSIHPFYQQHQQQQHENPNKHSPEHKPFGSDQSLYMAGRMHMPGPGDSFGLPPPHMMAPRKSSPDIYTFLSQPSPPQPSPPAPQQQPGPLQPSQQDVYGGQMGHRLVNSISPVMMVGGDGRLASAPSPPHPDDQTPGNMPDLQANRQKLFYHLTALFPEDKVREAMQRLPMETQPDKLVACIMSIRSLHSTA